MTIRLWKGYHGAELAPLVAGSWDANTLLILCPPLLQDFSFISAFPPGGLELYGAWSSAEAESLKAVPRRATKFTGEAPALGVFTSGTLSVTPRLVLYSRRNVLASLDAIYALFDLDRIQHVFCYPQAFHTFGLTLGYLAAHKLGWHLHAPEGKYSSSSHHQRIELREDRVLTLGTPTHFFDLCETLQQTGASLTPSYTCILGGAPVSQTLWLRVRNELSIEAPSTGYGCTEAAPGITHLPPGQVPTQDDEIGYPLSSIRSRIAPENGVRIEGESLCIGIIQNGQLETPHHLCIRDRIETTAEGRWLYRGRLDLTMNRGGAKYSLEAIEKAVLDGTGLTAVAVQVRDARLGEDLALAVQNLGELTREQMLTSLQTTVREVFSLKLLPERTHFLPTFPLNECSKLDRKSVAALFDSSPGFHV